MSYLWAYTPMKRFSPLCVPVGAVPGALPPVIGWVAARGELSVDAWVIFAIMFLWQIPHTLAIACLYREDFAKAGIQFLPVIEPDGESTNRQIIVHCSALLVVSLLPTLIGLAGAIYFVVAFFLGIGFLASGVSLMHGADAHGRAAIVVCVSHLSSCAVARDGVGSGTAMNQWLVESSARIRAPYLALGHRVGAPGGIVCRRSSRVYHRVLD